jgi:hypothetical protein
MSFVPVHSPWGNRESVTRSQFEAQQIEAEHPDAPLGGQALSFILVHSPWGNRESGSRGQVKAQQIDARQSDTSLRVQVLSYQFITHRTIEN